MGQRVSLAALSNIIVSNIMYLRIVYVASDDYEDKNYEFGKVSAIYGEFSLSSF